ncbi:MAG TPA: hypothetical protein VK153_00760 [Candidatus Paceibacterota bacterium]|nr:hypothetical protein [Candidatus Paceibacterota bacterium]
METLTFPKKQTDSSISKDAVLDLIKSKTNLSGRDCIIEHGQYSGGEFLKIKCLEVKNIYLIAKVLEKDPFYQRRISMGGTCINISSHEKVEAYKSLCFILNFFNKLKRFITIPFEITTSALAVASLETITVVFKTEKQKELFSLFLSDFKDWNPRICDKDSISILVTKKMIEKFVGENKNCVVVDKPPTIVPEVKIEPETATETVKKEIPRKPISVKEIGIIGAGKPPASTAVIKQKEISKIQTDFKRKEVKDDTTKKTEEIKPETVKEDTPAPNIVYMSRDYDDFHNLSFNRKVNGKRVRKLVRSMEKHGVTSFSTIVETDCIDGVMKKWVVDGQHRNEAFKIRNEPILFTKAKANTVEELVELITDLNTTSKSWTLKEYLHLCVSMKVRSYMVIEKYLNETKLPITLLLEIFSGVGRAAATKMLQRGKFKIKNIKTAREQMWWMCELKRFLPKSRDIMSALVVFFNKTEGYDNEKMKTILEKTPKTVFSPGETLEQILAKLENLYISV